MTAQFQDKPVIWPKCCPDGKAVKRLTLALLDRRATSHFKPDAVPEEYLYRRVHDYAPALKEACRQSALTDF